MYDVFVVVSEQPSDKRKTRPEVHYYISSKRISFPSLNVHHSRPGTGTAKRAGLLTAGGAVSLATNAVASSLSQPRGPNKDALNAAALKIADGLIEVVRALKTEYGVHRAVDRQTYKSAEEVFVIFGKFRGRLYPRKSGRGGSISFPH